MTTNPPNGGQSPKFLDMDGVVSVYGIKKGTLYKLTAKKEIPCFKVGKKIRFCVEHLEKWMSDKSKLGNNDRNEKGGKDGSN